MNNMGVLEIGGLGGLQGKNGGLGKVKSTPLKSLYYITLYLYGGLGGDKIRNIKKVIKKRRKGMSTMKYIELTGK